ncbi:MAG: hypothetical protein ACTHJ4_06230 [Candidatus Nucleicultricaceae bacterium]
MRHVEDKSETAKTEDKVERKQRRRKRDFEDVGPLGGIIKDPGYHYYWAVDGDLTKPGNVHRLTHEDDYDIVTPKQAGIEGDEGSVVRRPADKQGLTYHYLLRKPIEYYNEDMDTRCKKNMKGLEGAAIRKSLEGNNKDIQEFQSLQMNQQKIVDSSKI